MNEFDSLDVSGPKLYETDMWWPIFARLRAEDPLWAPHILLVRAPSAPHGGWLLTRHAIRLRTSQTAAS